MGRGGIGGAGSNPIPPGGWGVLFNQAFSLWVSVFCMRFVPGFIIVSGCILCEKKRIVPGRQV